MPTVEAVDTFAEFLHIDPAGIEVVRESEPDQEHEPDIAFAGVVRHRPPTEDPWWGPRDAEGMATCRLKVGRLREDGRPYVQGARWQANRMPGDIVVDEAQAETIAREFLRTYCPFYDEGLQPVPPEVLRRTSRPYWSSFWHRETDTTSLRMNLGMRLDDGSIVYNCWYRTGLTPAAITEEQAKQIAEEQWRAKYPEQELVYEKTSKLLESEFSPTRGPAWMVTYRRGPEGGRTREGGTERVWLTIDAVTGAITRAPNFTPPKLTREEAQRICEEQWLAKWPDEKLELVRSAVWLDCELSPSHGPVWYLPHRRSTEGALPVSDPDLAVCIDGLTGEILRAPNLTKPKLS
ncbi:MAG TPA: PepSY domain-containing protein, partial [Armatimonadota bacterium]|nr:PepSY domain-containing protein [Armatimonadota bacterium]